MSDTFTCAICDETFEKARTDEEAMQDALQHFTKEQLEDACLICDPCHKRLMAEREAFSERQKVHDQKMKDDPLYAIVHKAAVQMLVNDLIGNTNVKN